MAQIPITAIARVRDLANTQVLVGAVGVGAGGIAGNYLGELAKTTLGQTGWLGFGVKTGVKALIAVGAGVASMATRGVLGKIFLSLASIGSLGSVVVDAFQMMYPGGAVAGGQISGLMLRQLALGSKALATTTTTTTSTGADVFDAAGDGNQHLATTALAAGKAGVTDYCGA